MQLYGFARSQHALFKITGSFFNPGPYSGWLATVFPAALGYALFNREFNREFNHEFHELRDEFHESGHDRHEFNHELHELRDEFHESGHDRHEFNHEFHELRDEFHESGHDRHKFNHELHELRDEFHESGHDRHEFNHEFHELRDEFHESGHESGHEFGHDRHGRGRVVRGLVAGMWKTGLKILCWATCLGTVLVLPAAMSRASWLAALGGSAFIGIIYVVQNKKVTGYLKKYGKRVFVLSLVAVILSAVAFTGLFFLKKDSASGRALTWKIALQTVGEHPAGVGLGNFAGSYGDMQAAYFASGAGTEREEHVAGGVEYAFNEYLQICVETGIVPFILFLVFVVYVLIIGVRRGNYFPAGSLVALLIFAGMSYPFNVLPFVIAFVFLSAMCLNSEQCTVNSEQRIVNSEQFIVNSEQRIVNSEQRKTKAGSRHSLCVIHCSLFIINCSLFVVLCSPYTVHCYEAYRQWNGTRLLYQMNIHAEAAEEYAKQYPYLQDEIKFLFEYAQSLSKSEQYEKSNEILQHAMKISCDPMLYNVAGKNHQALKEYALAERCLKKAANLVPSRLYPYYLLAKLYKEMGLMDKARETAAIALTKEPKVHSQAVEEMREEMMIVNSE
jgi:hypothetical protein